MSIIVIFKTKNRTKKNDEKNNNKENNRKRTSKLTTATILYPAIEDNNVISDSILAFRPQLLKGK